jgi:glycosyltransferase involved in cell wall biosynthesis
MSLTEGNGKIYNYMAMGLPVVAFDAPSNREILGSLGVYAGMSDADDFANQVIGLMREPERRAAIGRQLRERVVAEMSWSCRVRELLAVYAAALARTGSSSTLNQSSRDEIPHPRLYTLDD